MYRVRYNADVVRTAGLMAVEKAVRRAADSPGSMVAIIGPCGSGKTTSVRQALEKLGAGHDVIHVEVPQKETLSLSAVQDTVIEALGETPIRFANAKVHQFKRVLGERTKDRRHILVVIDEAHALPIRVLKGLKRLLELTFAMRLDGLFSVVLVGQSEMRSRLRLAPEANKRTRRVEVSGLAKKEAEMVVRQVAEYERLSLTDDAVTEIALEKALPLDLVQTVTDMADWAQERGAGKLDGGMVKHFMKSARTRLMQEYGITIGDIASRTGMAKSTVSAALDGKYDGKRETRVLVEDGLQELLREKQEQREGQPAMVGAEGSRR